MVMDMPVNGLQMCFVKCNKTKGGDYSMLAKLRLYANTVKLMKPSQIYYRVRKTLKLDCSIGCKVTGNVSKTNSIATVRELDFDSVFLERFPADEFFYDKVTFLHSSKIFHWNEKWHFDDKSALWNFNLHYFEFLFSLVNAYRNTGEKKYLDKSAETIRWWIVQNPKSSGGEGWSPYTIDLRLTNWLSYYTAVKDELDDDFQRLFIKSIHEQYEFLSRHLEKDILGNHYFEDLKTLVLCALFFKDEKILKVALKAFKQECREEILPDGMHFELSPMYHKLIFEGVIRVAVALKDAGREDRNINCYLQPMLDAAWSMEEGMERIPLFNDSGNNVAKSLQALVFACKNHFGITPKYRTRFENSGFYIFKKDDWKLIVDAGQPGPAYIPGHAHCDAMSFELFKAGKPVIVNCGTYAYQCKERNFFRGTAAHNTVMLNNTEQSQCWGAFRMAKRSRVKVVSVSEKSIVMELVDQKGQVVRRTIQIGDNLSVTDESNGKITGYLHIVSDILVHIEGNQKIVKQQYACKYGAKIPIDALEYEGVERVSVQIDL